MKSRQFLMIVILVVGFALLLSTIAFAQSAATPIQAGQGKVNSAGVVPGSTIVVAMFEEPESLYLYGTGPFTAQQHVLQAYMDGPIDNVGYEYQAVILDKVPSLDDGDAITQTAAVGIGDYYVNSLGEVVEATEPLSATQMVVTFTLKPDIYWSDGTLLTTADSVLSQEIDCHPDTPTSKFICDRTADYSAPNPQTAIWTGLPGWLDSQYFLRFWTPLPNHILANVPPGDIPDSDYATNPLGWGPFQVDEWIAGDSIQLSRNPYYWRSDLPGVDKLVFKFMSSSESLHALMAGEVHLITHEGVGTESLSTYLALEQEGAISVQASPTTIFEHINFGIDPADNRYVFFDDVEVRRALTLCTNRQQMVDTIYAGLSEIAHAYAMPDHPLYAASDATEWSFDPAQGRAKLEAAGWLVGAGGWRYQAGQKFEVTYQTTSNTPHRQQIAEIFKANMAACGVDVQIEYVPASEFYADWPTGPLFGRQFDLAQFAWFSGVQPPCELSLTSQIPGAGNSSGSNVAGYSNPAFDAACTVALDTLPTTSQNAGAHIQALEIWTEDVPAIPLYPHIKANLSNPNLFGIQLDPTQTTEFWNVEEWQFTAEATITPAAGGTLTSNDGRVTVEIPAGAFTDTITLRLTPSQPEVADDLFSGGQFFDLQAVYASTGQPAMLVPEATFTVTINYSPLQLINLWTGEVGLGIYNWDGSEWVLEPTSAVNFTNKTVTATADHFSLWSLLSTSELIRTFLPAVRTD